MFDRLRNAFLLALLSAVLFSGCGGDRIVCADGGQRAELGNGQVYCGYAVVIGGFRECTNDLPFRFDLPDRSGFVCSNREVRSELELPPQLCFGSRCSDGGVDAAFDTFTDVSPDVTADTPIDTIPIRAERCAALCASVTTRCEAEEPAVKPWSMRAACIEDCNAFSEPDFEAIDFCEAQTTLCAAFEPCVCNRHFVNALSCARPTKRVFVTVQTYRGDFAGAGDPRVAADVLCQQAAVDAALGGTWRAYLSDGAAHPLDRFTAADISYVSLTNSLGAPGVVLFQAQSSLRGTPTAEFPRRLTDAQGNQFQPGELRYWTGMWDSRTPSEQRPGCESGCPSSNNCENWTSGMMSNLGQYGANWTVQDWATSDLERCSERLRLLCFEQ